MDIIRRVLWLAVVFALSFSSAVLAQDDSPTFEPANPTGYPARFTQRPITLPAMTLRPDFRIGVGGLASIAGSETVALFDFGGAFGITDDLEVGLSGHRQGLRDTGGFLTFVVTPRFDFGDIYLYGRYRLVESESFELGAELGIYIPTLTDFAFVAAVPFRARFGDMFSIDGGFELEVRAEGDPEVRTILTVQPRVAPIDSVYFGLNTGLGIHVTGSPLGTEVPLGFEAGYVLDVEPTKIDIFANVLFPLFLANGRVFTDLYILHVGARAYFSLGD